MYSVSTGLRQPSQRRSPRAGYPKIPTASTVRPVRAKPRLIRVDDASYIASGLIELQHSRPAPALLRRQASRGRSRLPSYARARG